MHRNIQQIIQHYQPKPMGVSKAYAVLIPLIWEDNQYKVLYEVRAQHISQPGEVAFPGGRIEDGESSQEAAIRETCEELNLLPENIQILGEIDYIASNNRIIYSYVAQLTINNWRDLSPNEEVERLFAIPLDTLIAYPPTYHRLNVQVKPDTQFPFDRIPNQINYNFSSLTRQIPFYDLDEENLWGFTAQLTHRFTEIIKENKQS
ncbi:CoA pyrophosphatase [Tuanshanicoccus lijuaniae]|uniref:NUDIX hydrolase n=1 Tax=Aerococcaceae bacterium zg-1292 TaxID=2774330 RepID=UPI001938845C|nr:CoA pyrophosphatase [Aerococcaceae bacterium zg-1292]QQA37071.1 CoA pyrophosphatase [Aerococcaceae bacterium zg-1292]